MYILFKAYVTLTSLSIVTYDTVRVNESVGKWWKDVSIHRICNWSRMNTSFGAQMNILSIVPAIPGHISHLYISARIVFAIRSGFV